jgi:MOSC domain-containing protein YiiM
VKPSVIQDIVTATNAASGAHLVSVRVGRPRTIDDTHPWRTAFFKGAITGPLLLRFTNLEGDRQADLRVHGGADKAVCVYSGDHYPAWRRELGRPDMTAGAFGENFTVSGQIEADVCLGDRFRIGGAIVEISQPRGPCVKLARRWDRPDLPRLVVASGRSGWYLRVVGEGLVEAGVELRLLERPFPEWTIARVNDVTYGLGDTSDDDRVALVSCPALARSWQRALGRKV